MAIRKQTDELDEWLLEHHATKTVRDACIANAVRPDTIHRRERALGILCYRQPKLIAPSKIRDTTLMRSIRHMSWAPNLDYLE